MKVFLQDCKTAKFVRCDSSWSSDFNEALDFLSVRRAVSFGLKELKDAFQVRRAEANGLPGPVLIVIANLSWPEGSQSALTVSLANALPVPVPAPNSTRGRVRVPAPVPTAPLL
jgi:hypothetical protein